MAENVLRNVMDEREELMNCCLMIVKVAMNVDIHSTLVRRSQIVL